VLSDLVRRDKGKRAIVFHHRAAFMWSAYLTGLDNLLVDFLLRPSLAELVMDKALEVNMEIVRQPISDAGEGGGFILSSSSSIHSSCKPENRIAMVEARREFGSY
jgi:hypothetical protein